MCKFKLFLLILMIPITGLKAQFQVRLQVKNASDSIAYFRASIFDEKNFIPKDSISLKKGVAIIKNTKSVFGGIYYLYFPATRQKISFIVENKDTIKLSIEGSDYLKGAMINGTKNKLFLQYQLLEKSLAHFDSTYAKEQLAGKKFGQIQKAAFFKIKTDSLTAFRAAALKQLKPTDVLFIHFDALNKLDASVPNKKNIEARNNFIKQFDLNMPMLFFTPNIRPILVEYFSYYPLQADSMVKGVDTIMSKVMCTNKAYSFVFDYISKLLKNREIQNNTEGYAYFIRKYIKEGKCAFLDPNQKEAFLQELEQLQALKIKDTAYNLILPDTTGTNQSLKDIAKNYNYTILIFFDPSCEHCKVELPKMDSIIALLESQLLVKIGKYAVCNAPGASKQEWVGFINEHHLFKSYTHVQLGNDPGIRKTYDAFSNPLFYLFDRDAILLAKKISPSNLRKELLAAFQNFK